MSMINWEAADRKSNWTCNYVSTVSNINTIFNITKQQQVRWEVFDAFMFNDSYTLSWIDRNVMKT